MSHTLKNHPFAVEAHFESSLVLTFAIPKEELLHMIPACLELDTFKDEWAFIAVAMVQTKGLRPKGFPFIMGNDFFLIGYRIFVRYKNKAGKSLRGLYILKSETNKKKMELLGNIFTQYKYTTTDIMHSVKGDIVEIQSKKSNFNLAIEQTEDTVEIPEGSPFNNWKDARKFAGPLPHTFTYNKDNKEVLIIKGIRKDWKPAPVKVRSYSFEFLNSLRLNKVVLANAFGIKNVPYYWEKGRKEKWE